MENKDVADILRFTLETLKYQLEYTQLLHGWIVALNETLQKHDQAFASLVKQHSLYSIQAPTRERFDRVIQNIDEVIQRLKVQP